METLRVEDATLAGRAGHPEVAPPVEGTAAPRSTTPPDPAGDRMPDPDDLEPLVARTGGLQPWRRAFHAASGLALAWAPTALDLPRASVVVVLGLLLALLVAADVARLRAPRLNALFFRAFPSFASPREADTVASSTWYVLGGLLVYAVFPRAVAVPAILVLALADPAASALGRILGRRRVGKGTLEGGLVFLAVALAILVPRVGWAPGLVVAVGVTVVELLPWPLDDNLTIPVAAASSLWIVGA